MSVLEQLALRLRVARSERADELTFSERGATLSVRLVSEGARLRARLEVPLGFDFELRELRESDYYDFFSKPELTFDDSQFDEALLVRGEPLPTRRLLTPELRSALVELARLATPLQINRLGLEATLVRSRPSADELWALLVAAGAVLDGMQPKRRPTRAYR